jgi:hexosaminidase
MKGGRINFRCCIFFVITFLGRFNLVYAQCPVIPAPVTYQMVEGNYSIGGSIGINPEFLPENVKEVLIDRLTNDFQIRVVLSASENNVTFKKMFNTPEDFYSINVSDKITINYSSDRSCFYAVTSLIQMVKGSIGEYYIENCFLQDYPKFQWRGLHLDVSRHFFTVDEVKRYIDLMSMYKYNTFHWHLTDDQGWRIEIKKYPKLTGIGAWRDSTVNDHYTTNPRTYSVNKYGGYYTQEEIKDVVDYASKRYITVVPEIEMPGHSRAALAAYPEFSCTGEQMGVPGLWGVFDDVFCAHESTIDFLKDILDEVISLFPSEYIHIGGDEVPKTRWKKCKKCQAVIRENGLNDEHELQSYFIGEIDEYLYSKGRKIIGWDEILEGGLTPNAAVMSWRGFEGGTEAARQKHNVVMSPGSHCYFDHYQSTNIDEPLAIGGFTSLEKVYEFNPIPEGLTVDEASFILGAQANLWTEYIPDMSQLEYMTYPRALALSQVLWCQNKPEINQFIDVFVNSQMSFLDKYNVNYSKSYFLPEMEVFRVDNGVKLHFKANTDNYYFDLFKTSDQNFKVEDSELILGKNDTLFIERTKIGEVVNYLFNLTSEFNQNPTVFKLQAHNALGLPIDLLTLPNDRYSGKGAITLNDGIRGSLPWKGHEWLGFDTSEIDFQIDLLGLKKLNSLQLGFLIDHNSWIHAPNAIEIYGAKTSRKKWKRINTKGTHYNENVINVLFSGKVRYLKITVKSLSAIPEGFPGEGNVPWTFLDEIIVNTMP